jgi:hypothetical protein
VWVAHDELSQNSSFACGPMSGQNGSCTFVSSGGSYTFMGLSELQPTTTVNFTMSYLGQPLWWLLGG